MNQRSLVVYIRDIDVSSAVKAALSQANIFTLNQLEELGVESLPRTVAPSDIKGLIAQADSIFTFFEERRHLVIDQGKNINIDALLLPRRVALALKKKGISDFTSFIALTPSEMLSWDISARVMHDIDSTISYILASNDLFLQKFAPFVPDNGLHKSLKPPELPRFEQTWPVAQPDVLNTSDLICPMEKGFDYDTIAILREEFFFHYAVMSDWFGISRERIRQLLNKRSRWRQGCWRGKTLEDREADIVRRLIHAGKYRYKGSNVACYCYNNRQNSFACIFVYEDTIKCFFLEDLPEALQEEIIFADYQKVNMNRKQNGDEYLRDC